MECKEIETDDEYQQYYVGPKCSGNGNKIHLGVFTDEYCTEEYSDSKFKDAYGMSLPYTYKSIVSKTCISCAQEDANNDDGNVELADICEQNYDEAAKCETSKITYPDTSGCSYINNIKTYEVGYSPRKKTTAIFFALFFAITTVALGAYVMKSRQRKINLSSESAVV